MAYSVILKPSVQKSLLKLPAQTQTRILDVVQTLSDNPRPIGVKKLKSSHELYWIRIGDYRVIYAINNCELEILVVTIGHRQDVYGSL